ncbi:uncharacterized protein LOC6651264 [Drosophila willistoni]|uniref:uncharacterized protein LOC6651264 n=1 Tax=Drosophila willistoni TaxID=7260 RepID=UPI001F07CE68|nr:uncharacterized protein LOC6651264 [Drosophila willistoni]
MPKNKKKMNASPELEAILAEPITDADRLAEYLKRKADEVPKQDNVRLFGDFSIDLSFDVPLIKKPEEPKPTEALDAQKPNKTHLQESAPASDVPAAVPCDTEPPLQPPRAVSISPSRRSASKVPGSDRLRRVAIRRRSQSCGRRQLLKEFDNAALDAPIPSSPAFIPTTSSTPVENKKQSPTQNELHHEAVPNSERVPEAESDPNNMFTNLAQFRREVEATFTKSFNPNLTQGSCCPCSPQSAVKRRTYTIEKESNLAETRLSRSSSNLNATSLRCAKQTSIKTPMVRLRRVNTDMVVPDTPPVPAPRRRQPLPLSQPEVEVVVPETQPQELSMTGSQSQQLGEIIQNLSRHTSLPLVVIPINTQSPRADVAIDKHLNKDEPVDTDSRSIQTSSQQKVPALKKDAPDCGADLEPIDVISRSIQTTSQQKVEDIDILTDDDSDEGSDRTAPLNLAPPGGNTTRQKRKLNANYRKPTENQENSMQLLNLHRTNSDRRHRKATLASVLNKAPCTPINGEKFAGELVRMSNYEILDLRKRNSLGLIYPLNGHRKQNLEQQAALEEGIRFEIMRRNLDASKSEDLLSDKTQVKEVTVNVSTSMGPPPTALQQKPRRISSRSRSRRQKQPITKELENYMALEKTMQERIKSRSTSKRSLYTKGESETEDYSSSPEKQRRTSLSCRDSMSGPESDEDANIITTVVGSQSLQKAENQNRLSHKRREKSTNKTVPEQETLPILQTEQQVQADRNEPADASRAVAPPPDSNNGDDDDEELGHITSQHHQNEAHSPHGLSASHSSSPNKNNLNQQKENGKAHTSCLSKSSRNKDPEIEDLPNNSKDENELQTTHNNSNSIRVRSLDELMAQSPDRSQLEPKSPDFEKQMPKRMSKTKIQNTTNKEKTKGSASKKKSSNSSTSQKKLVSENQGVSLADNATEDVQIEHMEALRMDSPPPQPNLENDLLLDDDQPSTSKAAREALQRCKSQREQQAKATTKNDAVIFKKPLAPAPRAKKNKTKLERQLDKLKINIPLNGTMMTNFMQNPTEQHDTSIRRSKRGQVPLRNNFCHTIKDLTFVRCSFQEHIIKAKTTKITKPKNRSKETESDCIMTRPPLCSSTPCSVEPPVMNQKNSNQSSNAPIQSPSIISLGVAPFSDQEDNYSEPAPSSGPIKRKKGKKTTPKQPDAGNSVPEVHHGTSKNVEVATQSDPQLDLPNGTSNVDRSANQFTSWLHGSETLDTTNQLNSLDNHASTVKDLVFKNLEGIDYAFYNTAEKTSLGYMRFKPHQKRDKKRSKTTTMKFIVQYGQFAIETIFGDGRESESVVLRHGEMIEIENGTYYSITNMLDIVGVIMFIRI